MLDPDGEPHTAHTTNPVPVMVVGAAVRLRPEGRLADLAPTLLDLLDVPAPAAMTGRSLVER
jgi:2,3-bisphosphoglycerate-independent phosphoglycerate mutase